MSETQVGGDHYKKLKITPFQYSMANELDAMQHTAVKYITRFRSKNGILDLEKARDTINQLIDYETSQNGDPRGQTPTFPKIDWTTVLDELLHNLSATLGLGNLERIVIVPRGGLTLGHAIAEKLGKKEVELYNPSIVYEGNILLVDDINDSGSTLIEILSHPGRFRNGYIRTVVLAQRYSSKVDADFIGTIIDHDEYVTFPWESAG